MQKKKGEIFMVNEIAGIYSRLSQDDGNTGESGSIQTQKTRKIKK